MAHSPEEKERADQLSKVILGSAIEVHRHLGPGLLESAYEVCLVHELRLNGVRVEPQFPVPVRCKGFDMECAYRLDLFVEDLVVVELKSVERIEPVHEAQLLTYLRLTKRWLGLLINFNVPLVKDGFKRFVQG